MNTNLESGPGGEQPRGRQRSWIIGIGASLGVAYVSVRSAVAALALTYASAGKTGVLSLSVVSLLYLGFVSVLARWELIQKNASASWLYWIKGMPASLILGIIAMFMIAFMGTSQVAQEAYVLRVLLVVLALSSFISLSTKLLHLLRAEPRDGTIEGLNPYRKVSRPNLDEWKYISTAVRLLYVASYVLESALWTWLVIHYRYYSQSFLAESSWIMASLWLFLLSSWLHSTGAVVMASRWLRSGRDGVDAASGANA